LKISKKFRQTAANSAWHYKAGGGQQRSRSGNNANRKASLT